MRRIPLAALMLIAFSVTAAAQQEVLRPVPPPAPPPPNVQPSAQPEDMVARLMSFDRNGDGKIARDEVFERMESVIVTNDSNHDGALDRVEIQAIAARPPAQSAVRGFGAGRYGFGDESGFSSRLRIEGALDDLRLAGPVKEQAGAIVAAFMDALEKEASADLVKALTNVVPAAQLTRLQDALNTRSQIRALKMNGTTSRVAVLVNDVNRPGVAGMVAMTMDDRAMAAVDQFNARLSPGDAERSALLGKLGDVLTDEQRDDFRAALERRPVVKSGGAIAGGVAGPVHLDIDVQANPRVVVAGP